MILQCIAIDDEPLALQLVSKFISQTPFLQLAGQYPGAVEGLKAISTQQLDLILLDIQMPGLNGLELAQLLSKMPNRPQVIFTTAYHQFALEGYKVDARDYLLKPFNYDEFLRAATKAHNYIELLSKNAVPPVAAIEPSTEQSTDYLFLKVEYQLVRIALADISYIEGRKDYIKVHLATTEKPVLSLTSLKSLEEKLPRAHFMRLHRSYIVRLDKIISMTKNSIRIGTITIAVGDQYKAAFNKYWEKWL